MSKIIRMTPEMIEEATARFQESLRKMNCTDGKVQYSDTFKPTGEKATVWFTPSAYAKMIVLVKGYSSEVAWHGIAHRTGAEDACEYTISDILVYPQIVDGTNANTDQKEYEMWLMQQEDEVFNNIRMQGHSHVNMGVTPSAVDLAHQRKIVDQLEDDMFYIFMIWNKSFEYNARIYDLKKNVLFEPADVSVRMVGEEQGLAEFYDDSKKIVKHRYQQSGPNSRQGTTVYSGTTVNPAKGATTPTKDTTVPAKPAEPAKPVNSENPPSRPKPCIGNGWQGASAAQASQNNVDDDDDIYNNMYGGAFGGYGGYGGYYGQ